MAESIKSISPWLILLIACGIAVGLCASGQAFSVINSPVDADDDSAADDSADDDTTDDDSGDDDTADDDTGDDDSADDDSAADDDIIDDDTFDQPAEDDDNDTGDDRGLPLQFSDWPPHAIREASCGCVMY